MKLEEYQKKIQEVLQYPLTTDSPEELYKEAATIESLAYMSVKLCAVSENKLAKLNELLRKQKAEAILNVSGTQLDKTIQIEAKLSSLLEEIERAEVEMRYWKNMTKLIENKISLAQSILSNIGSQMKAGMYFNNIK